MKKSILICGAAILLTSCQTSQKQNDKSAKSPDLSKEQTEVTSIKDASVREYKTKTGKTILVTEAHPIGLSLSTITITTKDFEHNSKEIFKDVDPISKTFLADLDNNGFEELYIITTAAGSGSYSSVIGMASNRDKSMTPIYMPEITKKEMEKGETFEGYMGHDKYDVVNERIIREFPIYKENDSNANPTGGKRKVYYSLKAGEAGWLLKIEKTENIK